VPAWAVRRLAALSLLVVVPACQEPAREFSRGPAGAAAGGTLVEALALRFGPAQHDAAFTALRPKLAQAALVPSRVIDDPSAWPVRDGERRAVELVGYGSLADAYHLGVRREAPPPAAPGEYRGRVQLQRTGGDRYQWDVTEELAVGPVRVAELAGALDALLRAAEGTDGAAARAAVLRAFPRATPALGQLLRLETLALWREGGSTRVDVGVRLVPDALVPSAPRLARFVRQYFGPMQLHAIAGDAAGRAWWTLDASQSLWTLRLRTRGGSLVPLEGPPDARIPGDLRVTVDYETRMGRFRVGARRLAAELTLVRTPAEKGFVARFLAEPEWDLPFLVEPLLHGPLRHPFEAPGSEAGFSAREQPGGPTRLVRHFRARVRESFILRWLGGLTSSAMSDFRAGAEAELDAWARECLLAVRDDLGVLAR
jgi:hypothetical protein